MSETEQRKENKPVLGQVYLWESDPILYSGGKIKKSIVKLPRLDKPIDTVYRLSGCYVIIKNAGEINLPDNRSSSVIPCPLGDAKPAKNGNFIFEPFNGGGRMDKEPLLNELRRKKNIQVARFGEVNTYYHIDKIASYVDMLLNKLGERSLPRVKVLINAHHAVVEKDGIRDGYHGKMSGKWLPFQGGHYRLSSSHLVDINEPGNISPKGEIHLGPGWRLTEYGALPEFAHCKYRCNGSHNAGIIYHEYGHHITRHTADFSANRFRAPHRQSNRKSELDEGFSDYWAATILDCPHIWAWHRKHTEYEIHHRSLSSKKTMTDYDSSNEPDPHANGTIFSATLWDIRKEFCSIYSEGYKIFDLIVLKALVLIGLQQDSSYNPTIKGTRLCRSGFSLGLASLLEADEICFNSMHSEIIIRCFLKRGIKRKNSKTESCFSSQQSEPNNAWKKQNSKTEQSIKHIFKLDRDAIIPESNELLSMAELDNRLNSNDDCPFSLTAVGDVMLGSRMNKLIHEYGPEYPFFSVYPILRRSSIVLGNLEGPFADKSPKQDRSYSYKVNPKNARILRRAGFNVMSMANNHLLDCGRDGVLETIATLKKQGIQYIGAGHDKKSAHYPAIMQSGKIKIGLLAYYWNRRTSARKSTPGSAMDVKEFVSKDITNLRPLVDKLIISVHWGIPYERFPSIEDRRKAHFAIDCGADIVIGHHPHVVQPLEIYKNRPIFYSIGNFVFGSGNSKAESIILAFNFKDNITDITIFPVYIKNRDHRINYQPKVLIGNAASENINRLINISRPSGDLIDFKNDTGKIKIPNLPLCGS